MRRGQICSGSLLRGSARRVSAAGQPETLENVIAMGRLIEKSNRG